jgi:uncharacterized protein (UPF0332 family)
MNDYWVKSQSAARCARILFAAGEADGAVNRAYYAMFSAAKAALEELDPRLAAVKSHGSIIREFGKKVVIEKGLDVAIGRAINKAEDFRMAADYARKPIDLAAAKRVLEDMERLLDAVAQLIDASNP